MPDNQRLTCLPSSILRAYPPAFQVSTVQRTLRASSSLSLAMSTLAFTMWYRGDSRTCEEQHKREDGSIPYPPGSCLLGIQHQLAFLLAETSVTVEAGFTV
jgi:hypothetical protein